MKNADFTALHLQRGDPLPDLDLAGFDLLELCGGGWLVLGVAGDPVQENVLVELDTVTAKWSKTHRCALVVTARDADGPRLFADPDGSAARRLGALVGPDRFFAMVVLVDPRGDVWCSVTAEDVVSAARAAMEMAP